jgi:hypothetical protein
MVCSPSIEREPASQQRDSKDHFRFVPLPFLFNLYTNQQEDETKTIIGRVLKMIGAFEESTKKYTLIPMGTPDPYLPLTGQQ